MSVLLSLRPAPSSLTGAAKDEHCTVAYLGNREEMLDAVLGEIQKRAAFAARHTPPITATVVGVDQFDDGSVPVAIVEHHLLHALRRWFDEFDDSRWKVYRPHVSLPEIPPLLPTSITFDRIALWVGHLDKDPDAQRFAWRLGSGYQCFG